MKRSMRKFVLAGWILLGNGVQAMAGQEVSVGRVDVQLPGDGWQVYSVEDKGITLSGSGYTYQQTTEFKVIVHYGTDKVIDALILVRANDSGKGRFSGISYPDAKCPGSPDVFAEGDPPGHAARSFRCLKVGRQLSLAVSSALPLSARDWLTKNGWTLPPMLDGVSAVQHTNTGAFAVVVAYLRPIAANPVVTQTRALPDGLPRGMIENNVHWGRELQEAVSDSVYSIRGKLQVPKIEFVDVAIESPSLPAVPKPAAPSVLPAPPAPSDRG